MSKSLNALLTKIDSYLVNITNIQKCLHIDNVFKKGSCFLDGLKEFTGEVDDDLKKFNDKSTVENYLKYLNYLKFIVPATGAMIIFLYMSLILVCLYLVYEVRKIKKGGKILKIKTNYARQLKNI